MMPFRNREGRPEQRSIRERMHLLRGGAGSSDDRLINTIVQVMREFSMGWQETMDMPYPSFTELVLELNRIRKKEDDASRKAMRR